MKIPDEFGVAVTVTVAPKHATELLTLTVGIFFTSTIVDTEHPLELIKVMVVVPAVIPVTSPVSSIVATAVFEDTQGFVIAGVAEPVNREVSP